MELITVVKKWGDGGAGIYLNAEFQLVHDIKPGDTVSFEMKKIGKAKRKIEWK